MPKSRIARSCYCSIFNFSQNFHIVYNSTYTNLHSYQQWTRVPFFPHLHQNLLFLVLSATAFLTNMRWYHIIVLICISLMINNVEHLFMHLLAICMSSFEKCLFRSSAHFLIGLFVFLIPSYMSYLYILEINPLLIASFANIFSHSIGCFFTLFMVKILTFK